MTADVLPLLARAKTLRLCALTAALVLAGCATPPAQQQPESVSRPEIPAPSAQEQQTLSTIVSLQDRLDRVTAPLLLNNAELCKNQARNLLGITAKNKYSYSSDLANAAQKMYGLGEQLQVISVMPGSGAARQGLRKGDVLLMVEDKKMPQGPNAERQAATILTPLISAGRNGINLTVLRDGRNLTLNIPLTQACGFRVELGNIDTVNAYSDGMRALVTRGMVKFTQSDEELAYVIAKELAHNILGHADKMKMRGTVSDIIDNLTRVHPDASTLVGTGGVKPLPPAMDNAGDALSLYLLARAHYDIDRAVPFWRRLAERYPASVTNGYTALHPSTNARLNFLSKAVTTVKGKMAAQKPLIP